jgi:hypothetical protein
LCWRQRETTNRKDSDQKELRPLVRASMQAQLSGKEFGVSCFDVILKGPSAIESS